MNILEWQNQNSLSQYPFAEDSSLASNGGAAIPNGFLVDAQIQAPGGAAAWLQQLVVVGSSISGTIFTSVGALGAFAFEASSINNSRANIVDQNGVCRGLVVAGDDASAVFSALPLGASVFSKSAAMFSSACLFSIPEQTVTSLVVGGVPFSGKLALMEGEGVRLVKLGESEMRIDAVGAPNEDCCGEFIGNPLLGLNNAIPDQHGNIGLAPAPYSEPASAADLRQVLRITPVTNGVVFSIAKS